ncbi:hypothetical protein GBF38_010210 [Nibea albiflora]|uniref:Uncharacterized protein n=1 Tax=Nibea albiflora TaxID=240163 RepID=A0ACB7F9P8_NIBAL|nr:hypothetical protein GBF38_010210 [Nibea albiflora]
MERSLAPDQDRRHNVPSSSQPPNKAVPRRKPRGIAELKSSGSGAKLPRYKEGPELQGESGHRKAQGSGADRAKAPRRPDGGRRPDGLREDRGGLLARQR